MYGCIDSTWDRAGMNNPDSPERNALYADIVFDRPLDTPYCYAVPAELSLEIGVGKRVLAPFGRGDTGTEGYCVRVHNVDPLRTVKSIVRVIDPEALLTDTLLRLTRWMADYYMCGWGQVLQTALPAGVREKAGTREARFWSPCRRAICPIRCRR